MLDLEQFSKTQLPYVHPLYSGYGLFDDNKYHPFFIINGVYFAVSHTCSEDCIGFRARITGKYYSFTKERSYISVCNKPKRVAKRVGGYIYIKPVADFLKKKLSISSISELIITNKA